MPDGVDVRRVFATDGARVRSLRLESLNDPVAHIAFLDSYDSAASRPSSYWDERTVGAALSDEAAQFVAESGPRWVGTVTVLLPEARSTDYFGRVHVPGRALLVAVYVAPSHRGSGVLERLVDRAATWATDRGRAALCLDVHIDNLRAQSAYRRLGFTPTGVISEGPHGDELEMIRTAAQ